MLGQISKDGRYQMAFDYREGPLMKGFGRVMDHDTSNLTNHSTQLRRLVTICALRTSTCLTSEFSSFQKIEIHNICIIANYSGMDIYLL
jgi:hypothetical protein